MKIEKKYFEVSGSELVQNMLTDARKTAPGNTPEEREWNARQIVISWLTEYQQWCADLEGDEERYMRAVYAEHFDPNRDRCLL